MSDGPYDIPSSIYVLSIQRVLESVRRAVERFTKPFTQLAARFSLDRWLRETILETAERGLQSGELSEDDAKHLAQARDEFQSRFDSMMSASLMSASDNAERGSRHPADALAAIQSAFAIALYCNDPKSVQRAIVKHARDRKRIGDAVRQKDLDDAIIAEAVDLKEVVLAISKPFAEKLRPGVRERLGLSREGKDWPSADTIKGAISAHVKEVKTNRVNLT